MPDGSVIFPAKGPIPPDLEGFIRDPGDPFHFLPIWVKCKHRTEGVHISPCCGTKVIFQICSKGFKASLKDCKKCVDSGRNL